MHVEAELYSVTQCYAEVKLTLICITLKKSCHGPKNLSVPGAYK